MNPNILENPSNIKTQVIEQTQTNNDEMLYMTAEINGKTIFYHEATWALNYGLIPDEHLIFHKDGNPMNNEIDNLNLVKENEDSGDLHIKCNKIFHKSSYNEEFVKEHFNDVYLLIKKCIETEF